MKLNTALCLGLHCPLWVEFLNRPLNCVNKRCLRTETIPSAGNERPNA